MTIGDFVLLWSWFGLCKWSVDVKYDAVTSLVYVRRTHIRTTQTHIQNKRTHKCGTTIACVHILIVLHSNVHHAATAAVHKQYFRVSASSQPADGWLRYKNIVMVCTREKEEEKEVGIVFFCSVYCPNGWHGIERTYVWYINGISEMLHFALRNFFFFFIRRTYTNLVVHNMDETKKKILRE